MKAVVKNLSIILILFLGAEEVSAQMAFVTKKKFELKPMSNIAIVDTSIRYQSFIVPKTYSYDKLALFCKFEERVAQQSSINMRFRLGSLDYVNYLERKPNWQLSTNNTQ